MPFICLGKYREQRKMIIFLGLLEKQVDGDDYDYCCVLVIEKHLSIKTVWI
jgi:hypothetical protein